MLKSAAMIAIALSTSPLKLQGYSQHHWPRSVVIVCPNLLDSVRIASSNFLGSYQPVRFFHDINRLHKDLI